MNRQAILEKIDAAAGRKKADLVLKNGKVFNVFTKELEDGDLAIVGKEIVGVGDYEGEKEIDVTGKVLVPGLIDGHIHIESSMMTPPSFGKAVIPHGTTSVITDPHEITNVAGTDGIRFMMQQGKKTPLDIFIMLPSCVPATALDESGAVLEAFDLDDFITKDNVLGLAEVMDFPSVVSGAKPVIDKIHMAEKNDKLVDGHAPFLSPKDVNAYVTAGVRSDHECSDLADAQEKLRRGQWLMVREGTAAQNLEALLPLFDDPWNRRVLLVTDDKHPNDLINKGHIDYIIRKAIDLGVKPEDAIVAGSFNAAQRFHLFDRGALAPGYIADVVVVDGLDTFNVEEVYKNGKLVAQNGEMTVKSEACKPKKGKFARIYHSFNLDPIQEESLSVPSEGNMMRVAQMIPGELLTAEKIVPWVEKEGVAPGVDVDADIVKVCVFERYRRSGHIGVGFVGGYGLKEGAIATSIAHDSHNLITAGTNDADIALAANRVRENNGGIAIAKNGEIIGELSLPIGGLMTDEDVDKVDRELEAIKKTARELGISEGIDPFMTLSFLSLPVIPKLRINTLGLVDVDTQSVIPVRFTEE